jgi:hypothetical protein
MAATKRLFLPIFAALLAAACLPSAEANCKAHDASWDAAKGPLISQPSRSDPGKLKVEWSKIVTNGR